MFLATLTNDLFFSTSVPLFLELEDREGGFGSQLSWILKSPLRKKLIIKTTLINSLKKKFILVDN